jgi:hypothetical protein
MRVIREEDHAGSQMPGQAICRGPAFVIKENRAMLRIEALNTRMHLADALQRKACTVLHDSFQQKQKQIRTD